MSRQNDGLLELAWSPDGSRFAYTSFLPAGGSGAEPVRLYHLASGKVSTIVSCEPDRAPCASGVAWSPDGTRIALSYGGLDLVDPDGFNRTTLIDARRKGWTWAT